MNEKVFLAVGSCAMFVFIVLAFALGGHGDEHQEENASTMPSSAALYPHANGTLSPTATSGTVPLDWTLTNWLEGDQPPTFALPQATSATRILEAYSNITYRFPTPLVLGETRSELTIWFGISEERSGSRYTTGHSFFNVGPGEAMGDVQADFKIELPKSGLLVPTGWAPFLQVGHYYLDGTGANAPLLVLEKSSITLQTASATDPSVTLEHVDARQLSLAGGRCVADTNAAGTAQVTIPIDVTGFKALRIEFQTDPLVGDALSDVDFFLLDAEGDRVSHGAGPAGKEGIFLDETNLIAGKPVQLIVFNCHPRATTEIFSVAYYR